MCRRRHVLGQIRGDGLGLEQEPQEAAQRRGDQLGVPGAVPARLLQHKAAYVLRAERAELK
jgi:hypothetical protein